MTELVQVLSPHVLVALNEQYFITCALLTALACYPLLSALLKSLFGAHLSEAALQGRIGWLDWLVVSIWREGEIQHNHFLSFETPCSIVAGFNSCGVSTALEVMAREKGKRSVAPVNRVVRKSRSYSKLFNRRYSLLKELTHPVAACPMCGTVVRSWVSVWWGTRIKGPSTRVSHVSAVVLKPTLGSHHPAQGLCVAETRRRNL